MLQNFAWTAPRLAISYQRALSAHSVLLAAPLARELVATSVLLALRDHTTCSPPRTQTRAPRLVHSDMARIILSRPAFNVVTPVCCITIMPV